MNWPVLLSVEDYFLLMSSSVALLRQTFLLLLRTFKFARKESSAYGFETKYKTIYKYIRLRRLLDMISNFGRLAEMEVFYSNFL